MSKAFQRLSEGTKIALEMIEFQHDSFATDLEIAFAEVMKSKGTTRKELLKDISEMTFKRTGIRIRFITNSAIAAVMPFYSNENHIFLEKMWRGQVNIRDQRKILEQALEQKGSVDLKKCKVSGMFSEYETPMYMNFDQLALYKMTPGEVTAVYLHELGHAFSACEYTNRMSTTNQVLQNLMDTMLAKKTTNKEYIFRELKTINPKTTDEQLDKIFSGQNIILGRETFKFLKETVESQMARTRYDENAFETLADNFAARWGYGSQLVQALEKLQPTGIFDTKNSMVGWAIASLFSLGFVIFLCWSFLNIISVMVASSAVAGAAATFDTAVSAFYIGFLLFVTLMGHSSHATYMTYDENLYRYKRIRNQYVELLKDADLDAKQAKASVGTVRALDLLINEKKNYKNLVTLIIDFLTPGAAKVDDDIKMQRVLEELSSNSLYVSAAALRSH